MIAMLSQNTGRSGRGAPTVPNFTFASAITFLTLLAVSVGNSQGFPTHAVAADTSLWNLYGESAVAEQHGRPAIMLNSAIAELRNVEMRDGVLDVDAWTDAKRAFFGFDFRIEGDNFEEVYLRKHKTGLPDALQYTPVLNTGRNWQLYNGPGFTGAMDIPHASWFHIRLVITGAQARLYAVDTVKPVLVMDDLKSNVQKGGVALYCLGGPVCFSNFQWRAAPDVPWERHLPLMEKNAIVDWKLSDSFDALSRDLERPPSRSEADTMSWETVHAEPPGTVVIQRSRMAPHPRVTFQSDFSTRLKRQPGTAVVYAKTTLEASRDSVQKLLIGYSDEVSVFLNGTILFRGRSAQGFRDPGFLGIVYPEDDAVYLPLKKGKNELILAISELGGGWGFACRLGDSNP